MEVIIMNDLYKSQALLSSSFVNLDAVSSLSLSLERKDQIAMPGPSSYSSRSTTSKHDRAYGIGCTQIPIGLDDVDLVENVINYFHERFVQKPNPA
mmetsp:Transcript_17077/g.36086  ORF Transcript_17077/g.36086 Transcript_17077/m.36086 type:complete len:96 (+) Transcript_17077:556-843(+)